MSTKKIKKLVAEATHLRRLITENVNEAADAAELKLDNQTRAAMVDNVLDLLEGPLELLLTNCVDNEMGLLLESMEGDEDDETEDGDPVEDDADEDDESQEGEVINADFTESTDESD